VGNNVDLDSFSGMGDRFEENIVVLSIYCGCTRIQKTMMTQPCLYVRADILVVFYDFFYCVVLYLGCSLVPWLALSLSSVCALLPFVLLVPMLTLSPTCLALMRAIIL